jgi:hypothetical protein
MDNRLNGLRKEMNLLRAQMLRAEAVIRDQVNHDRDCTEAALGLMAMRAKMSALIRQWTLLGGLAHLPTIEERLKGRHGSLVRARAPAASRSKLQKLQKRRSAARA